MKRLISIVFWFAFLPACTTDEPQGAPDAGVMEVQVDGDAGVVCCHLYPDVAAISACVALPAGECGYVDCPRGGGSHVHDNVRVCGGSQ